MTGIYSQPIQYPTQPENAMRAKDGLRPLCFNRPDYPDRVQVMGKPVAVKIADGRWIAAPTVAFVDNPMSKDCKAWAVRDPDKDNPADKGEDPATESIPGRESWRCWGCRYLPQDPRVIAKAKEREAA